MLWVFIYTDTYLGTGHGTYASSSMSSTYEASRDRQIQRNRRQFLCLQCQQHIYHPGHLLQQDVRGYQALFIV